MAAIKISNKIVDYAVKKNEQPAGTAGIEVEQNNVTEEVTLQTAVLPESDDTVAVEAANSVTSRSSSNVIQMHEKIERPGMLVGSTYKVKTPVSDHAMYVTINDVILNAGTEHESRRPFEIFVNTKNLDHYQWIVALTLVMSSVFRKGGDVTFLVDELKQVFDPRGGYWKPGGKYMPSVIAELGEIIEEHLISIGLLRAPELDETRKKLIEEKKAQLQAESAQQDAFAEDAGVEGAQLCKGCHSASVVMMDGCMTCLNCGDSKCG